MPLHWHRRGTIKQQGVAPTGRFRHERLSKKERAYLMAQEARKGSSRRVRMVAPTPVASRGDSREKQGARIKQNLFPLSGY